MRQAYQTQPKLRESWLDLDHARELKTISDLLDLEPRINELILRDLQTASGGTRAGTGAGGMTAEQVVRALLIKQMNGFSYRELAFHLADSRTYRTFCRLGITETTPSKSTLAANIKALRAETLEQVHRLILSLAEASGIERGRKVRVDCTVVESSIHAPTDSWLLWDCVRTLTRLMVKARKLLDGDTIVLHDRTRRAKRRYREIGQATRRKRRRVRAYQDLIRVTEQVCGWAQQSVKVLEEAGTGDAPQACAAQALGTQLAHFLALTERVLDQTRRRVLLGESVPATEKLVSIFEDHTDIVVKRSYETLYGHKICLTGGRSSMILDCVVLEGNPADSTLAQQMIERQGEIYQRPPRQAVFDGGFASRDNLSAIKSKGVQDVAFAKRAQLTISDMVRSAWVYKRLRNFRAGIEGNISFLKRIFGLDRCTWRSFPSFRSYVWSSILSFNLLILARHLLA